MKAKWINFDVVATCLMYRSYRLHDTGVTGATEVENDPIKPGVAKRAGKNIWLQQYLGSLVDMEPLGIRLPSLGFYKYL